MYHFACLQTIKRPINPKLIQVRPTRSSNALCMVWQKKNSHEREVSDTIVLNGNAIMHGVVALVYGEKCASKQMPTEKCTRRQRIVDEWKNCWNGLQEREQNTNDRIERAHSWTMPVQDEAINSDISFNLKIPFLFIGCAVVTIIVIAICGNVNRILLFFFSLITFCLTYWKANCSHELNQNKRNEMRNEFSSVTILSSSRKWQCYCMWQKKEYKGRDRNKQICIFKDGFVQCPFIQSKQQTIVNKTISFFNWKNSVKMNFQPSCRAKWNSSAWTLSRVSWNQFN